MDIDLRYQQTLDYLYSFVDYSLTKASRWSAAKFDLTRMATLLEQLNHPERGYAAIHTAGTKGKGSVSAFCTSVLRAAGYRTGLYTSPHLHDYAERIQLDGIPISHEDLIDLVDEIRPIIESIKELTTFEITTALAFLHFQRQKAEAAVVEVGLGGRLDATNIISPVVSVITSISYDHMFILGDTLAEIAGEKAGIIKTGVPVIVAPQNTEARKVIMRVAEERSAPLYQVGCEYKYLAQEHELSGQNLIVWREVDGIQLAGDDHQKVLLRIPLLGEHQLENAAVAYAALDMFRRAALPISNAALQVGFANVRWPGRFEILCNQPMVIIDCAHNRDSAQKLRQTLEIYFPNREVILVFGASEDKDITGMIAELMPVVGQVILTRSTHPRAAGIEQLKEIVNGHNIPVLAVPDISDALSFALETMDEEQILLVTGSIFIAAGAREVWLARNGLQPGW